MLSTIPLLLIPATTAAAAGTPRGIRATTGLLRRLTIEAAGHGEKTVQDAGCHLSGLRCLSGGYLVAKGCGKQGVIEAKDTGSGLEEDGYRQPEGQGIGPSAL